MRHYRPRKAAGYGCMPTQGRRSVSGTRVLAERLRTDVPLGADSCVWFVAGQGARGWQAGGLPDPGASPPWSEQSLSHGDDKRAEPRGYPRVASVSPMLSACLPVR